jgi:5-(carboxyamino)imidazole ribonucleotide mutase
MRKVAVIMGSDSDLPVMAKAVKVLKDFGIPYEAHIYSAHRTPEEAVSFAETAKQNGFGVIIAGAGMAAALAGVLAGHTTLPVIGVPLKSAVLDGVDALYSTVMMPSGIPVATVAIDGAKNAAYLAAEILAVSDKELAGKIEEDRQRQKENVLRKDAGLAERLKEF